MSYLRPCILIAQIASHFTYPQPHNVAFYVYCVSCWLLTNARDSIIVMVLILYTIFFHLHVSEFMLYDASYAT